MLLRKKYFISGLKSLSYCVFTKKNIHLSTTTHCTVKSNHADSSPRSFKNNFETSVAFSIVQEGMNQSYVNGIEGSKSISILSALKDVNNGTQSINTIQCIPGQLAKEMPNLSNKEIIFILHELIPLRETAEFIEIFKIIDKVGQSRVPSSSPSSALAICMKMAELRVAYKSEWVWSSLKRFCRRLDKLTAGEMLQVMFLAQLCRRFPPIYSSFDIHHGLVRHFENLTLKQMAVVSLAFFKTETKLSNSAIMSSIMRKLLEEAGSCDNYSIVMLCKIIRYSLPLPLSDELYVFQSKLVPYLPNYTAITLTHIALSGTGVLVYNEEMIATVLKLIRGRTHEMRIKDVERLLLVMSLFNMDDKCLIEEILNGIASREEEIIKYPKCIISLAMYLTIVGLYDYPLISRVLSKSYINDIFGRNGNSFQNIARELVYVDKSVEVERPDYTGNRLPLKIVTKSSKISTFSGQAEATGTQRFAYEVEDQLKILYNGKQNVAYCSILPHYCYPDLVMRFDDTLSPQPIPAEWSALRWGEVKHALNDQHIWLVVVCGGWNMLVRNTGEPLGTLIAKLRQLRILKFHPVVISYSTWRQTTDKATYTKSLIDQELRNISANKLLKSQEK